MTDTPPVMDNAATRMTSRLRWLRWSFCAFAFAAVLLIGYTLPRLTFENDILALFPQEHQRAGVSRANELIGERVTRKVFFLIGSDDWHVTRAAVPAFAQVLADCACFASVTTTPDASAFSELYRIYSTYAPQLLTATQRTQLRSAGGAALAQKRLRDILANPSAGLAQQIQGDPLATLNTYVQALRPAQTNMRLDDSGLVSFTAEDKRYVLVLAELSDSPYSVAIQQQAQAALSRANGQLQSLPGLDVIKTGALFYTLAGTAQARSEISTVGLGSALGIILLLLLVFRSAALLVLAFVPIVVGVLLGLCACFWLFGSVHIIALVFGASLVGVAIDYALHFFTRRHALASAWQPATGMQHLLPALSLGLLSSVAAYLSFTLAGFPGFTQVAVFSCVGLISAYWVVVGLYPWLLQRPAERPLPALLVRGVKVYRQWLWGCLPYLRRWPILLLGGLLLVAGLWQLRAVDDVRRMQLPDAQLQRMDSRFQALVGRRTALQYLLVSAPETQLLLQQLEALQPELRHLQEAGALSGFQSLADYLPSQQQQIANQQVWREALIDAGPLPQLLDQLGVVPAVREAVVTRFSAAPDKFLSLDQLSPVFARLPDAPLVFHEQDRLYAVVLLQGLSDPAALQQLARDNASVEWVDAVAQTSHLLREYRLGTAGLLVLAYIALWLLLSWRYSWRGSLAIVAPPLLATLLCLAALGWASQSISVFNLMALLLVLGIGIDAALFMRESQGRHYDTLLAIGLSTLTTILSFGLLSLSATAAIHSFGVTILLGIFFCFLLSPLAAIGLGDVAVLSSSRDEPDE